MISRVAIGSLVLMSLGVFGCGSEKQRSTSVGTAELPCTVPSSLSPPPGPGESWQSAEWPPISDGDTCFWFHFNSNTRYELSNPFTPARVPDQVLIYIAFTNDGTGSTLGSGDAARVVQVTDTTITIENATNQDFFAKVVLR